MPTFVYPALLWGLPIVGVPVLIHLINMMRHRRIQWAAMEFLLASQKKNRTWIFLKQLLLLLLRMTAAAIVVLMVAKPRTPDQLGAWFGAGRTHHIVLLDDSFSMSDRWGETSAFEEAKVVIQRIGAQAARQLQPQSFTLLRFSRAEQSALGARPDFLEEPVDSNFVSRLDDALRDINASETAVGPQHALETILQLVGSAGSGQRLVYLVSDFRTREWDEPGELKDRLVRVSNSGAKLHLIRCVDSKRPNLAITGLRPGSGIRAADVPLSIQVTVANYGDTPARDVAVLFSADDQPRPAVKIREIPPGQTVTQQFPVRFAAAGEHRVVGKLESDSVSADNFRYCVVDLSVDVPVLLVDSDPAGTNARYLKAALDPGGTVNTGIRPLIEGTRYLSLNRLDGFRAIYLLDVDRLEPAAVEALETYLAAGGGVGFFLGDRTDVTFFNEQLFRGGEGPFPLPLAGQAQLLVDRLRTAPDLQVGDHPIFQVLAGRRNTFINTVVVERYFAAPDDWKVSLHGTTQVIAYLRNGAPLAAERSFGNGRVIALLSTLAPVWNNWARSNPSFVVAMLELQAYLARPPENGSDSVVGQPLEVKLDAGKYERRVQFQPPGSETNGLAASEAVADQDGTLNARLAETSASGIYRVKLTPRDGREEVRSYAVNVEPAEGDLTLVDGQALASRLTGVDYRFVDASLFQFEEKQLGGNDLSLALLYGLVLLLLGEQLLAWSAGYHPSRRRPLRAAGGAA